MTKDEVLAKLVFDVELRGLSKNTQNEYYSRVKSFQDHYNKPATELDIEDIRQLSDDGSSFKYFIKSDGSVYHCN